MSRGADVRWPIGPSVVVKTVPAGAAGSRRWSDLHGHALVCVRHRHDAMGLIRYTTVELVVDGRPRHPREFANATFGLGIARHPAPALESLLAEAGARWEPREGAWRLRGEAIWRLGLASRIVTL